MNIIGIICEYNPFHNGHLYHLKKIKEMFPNSLLILVLNGYFLQRGEISIVSKKNKIYTSLLNGIDLVIELPFVFGSQSADIFANISITILEKLNCEYVIFGSESNNLKILNKIVDYEILEKEKFNQEVKNYLKKGYNYPTACAKSLNMNFEFKPNDLLGISYIKSIKENKYKIKPLTIQRTNDYLDTISNEDIVSASNVREKLNKNESISKFVPKSVLPYINNLTLNNIFDLLKYKIITDEELDKYLDVDEGIENRLKKVINECYTTNELIEKIKSKRYTYNKIKRMIIHILIGFTKADNKALEIEYIKILGFNNRGKKYLNSIKKYIDLPLKPQKDSIIYKYEKKCATIYDLIANSNTNIQFENSNKPINL